MGFQREAGWASGQGPSDPKLRCPRAERSPRAPHLWAITTSSSPHRFVKRRQIPHRKRSGCPAISGEVVLSPRVPAAWVQNRPGWLSWLRGGTRRAGVGHHNPACLSSKQPNRVQDCSTARMASVRKTPAASPGMRGAWEPEEGPLYTPGPSAVWSVTAPGVGERGHLVLPSRAGLWPAQQVSVAWVGPKAVGEGLCL